MSTPVDPYREFLREKGVANAETMPSDELSEVVYQHFLREKRFDLDGYQKLIDRHSAWHEKYGTGSTPDVMDRLKKLGPERRQKVREALARFADDSPAEDYESTAAEMERKLAKKFGKMFEGSGGNDGARLIDMSISDAEHNQPGGSRITYSSKGAAMATETVDDVFIRVKGSDEQYRNSRHVLKHAKWDRPIHPIRNGTESAAPVESLTEWEYAKIGALIKYRAAKVGVAQLSEHDRAVLHESFEKDEWVGFDGEKSVRHRNVKSLIEDNTSGGNYLIQTFFDRAVVQFPLLNSEILPYVDIVDVPKGTAVQTASVGNPTLTWNNAEGSAATPFTTTALVAQITSTIFPVDCFVEIGRDLWSDSLPMIGSVLVENLGERIANELDKVITNGDGTTQPQGIMNATGTVNVTSATPTTGPVTVGDLLGLMFGVAKQYRKPSLNPRFAMTDTRYKSHRAIATGVTGDSRLLHGMDVQSYRLLEAPVSIENSGLHVDYGIFGCFKKYRLWRRTGFDTRLETGGRTLALSNTVLLCGRGRYGGKVVDANAFSVMTSWPTT